MAVVNTKAARITAADGTPQDLLSPKILGGRVRETIGQATINSGDSAGSTFKLVRLPSRARISQVLLSSTADTAEAVGDVGVYRIPSDGGAVVDVDHFGDEIALDPTVLRNVDITHQADPADAGAGFGKADVEKTLWQSLGFSADPQCFFDIVVTLTASVSAGPGVIALHVRWTED